MYQNRDNVAWRRPSTPTHRRIPSPVIKAAAVLVLLVLFLWGFGHGGRNSAETGVSTSHLLLDNEAIPSSQSPPRSRVAIITLVTDQRSYIQLSLKNKEHYARLHGYDLIVDYETTAKRGTVWHKFVMLKRVISAGQHDWVWWIDFDTLITNTTTSLLDVINEGLATAPSPDNIDFILTNDCNHLSVGSMVVRSNPRVIKFLQRAAQRHDSARIQDNRDLNEQDAMRDLLDTINDQHIFVPQTKLNAVPEEIGCYESGGSKWEHGMFVIHFAGASARIKGEDPTGELMRKYQNEIIWGTVEEDDLF